MCMITFNLLRRKGYDFMKTISYWGKSVEVIYKKDVVIVGGGTAGAAAAISSLEYGGDTLVVERAGALGGSQTLAMVAPMMSLGIENYDFKINSMIKEEIRKYGELIKDNLGGEGWFNSDSLKYILQKMITDRNGDILYFADVVDVIMEDASIKYIVVNTLSGLSAVEGKTFIDGTGNALLSKLAGVPIKSGEDNTGRNQSMSLRFEMGGIDIDKFSKYIRGKRDFFSPLEYPFFEAAMVFGHGFALEEDFRKAIENGELQEEDAVYFQCFTIPGKTGSMTFNCPEIPMYHNATDPIEISKATIKGREMIHRLVKFLAKNIQGFKNAYLSSEASLLGIRESSRIVGKYVLTAEDVLERKKFKDPVVKTAYPIDVHGISGYEGKVELKKGEYYEIPFTSLVTKEVKNLAVVGRCISTDFLVQSSARVQLTCRATGEAAGKAAAYSVKNAVNLNDIKYNEI